jgi:hypothetical protein
MAKKNPAAKSGRAVKSARPDVIVMPAKITTAKEAAQAFAYLYKDKKSTTRSDAKKSLERIPEQLRTGEFYLEAMKVTGSVYQYIPEELLSMDICVIHIGKQKKGVFSLSDIPARFKTPEFYLKAAKTGTQITFVPEGQRTEELCLEAMKVDFQNFYHVPRKLFTKEFTQKAMRLHSELPMAIVGTKDWKLFEYVPEDLITGEFCASAAFETNGKALELIPARFKTAEFYTWIAKKVRKSIATKMTVEFWVEAVKKDSSLLEYVPKKLLDNVNKKLG